MLKKSGAHTHDITLGGIGEKAVRVDGQLEFREYLSMTISVDHDIIDGAPATRFGLRLKELIESGFGLIDQDVVSGQIATHALFQHALYIPAALMHYPCGYWGG